MNVIISNWWIIVNHFFSCWNTKFPFSFCLNYFRFIMAWTWIICSIIERLLFVWLVYIFPLYQMMLLHEKNLLDDSLFIFFNISRIWLFLLILLRFILRFILWFLLRFFLLFLLLLGFRFTLNLLFTLSNISLINFSSNTRTFWFSVRNIN